MDRWIPVSNDGSQGGTPVYPLAPISNSPSILFKGSQPDHWAKSQSVFKRKLKFYSQLSYINWFDGIKIIVYSAGGGLYHL